MAAVTRTMSTLAARIQSLTAEIRELEKLLTAAVHSTVPALPDLFGLTQDSAATFLLAADGNPERFSNELPFAGDE